MSAALLLVGCFVMLGAGLACGWMGVLGGNNARLRQLQRDVGMAFDDLDALDGRLRRREGAAGQAARKARQPEAPLDGPATTEDVAEAKSLMQRLVGRPRPIALPRGAAPPGEELFDPGEDPIVREKQKNRA